MATGITGIDQLDGMIATLRGMAEPSQYVTAAARTIETHLRGTIAAGQAPDGTPWKPRVLDGGKPLKNAADGLSVRVAGRNVIVSIKGRWTFHHFGAQGKPTRRVIPWQALPTKLGNAIRAGFVEPFKAASKAGKRGYAYYRKRGINPRALPR